MPVASLARVTSMAGRQLVKLLADGQWHPLNETRQRVAEGMPPGPAIRTYLARVQRREDRDGPRKTPLPADRIQIRLGQKLMADDAVSKLRRNYFDVDSEGPGEALIRLKPEHVSDLGDIDVLPQADAHDTEQTETDAEDPTEEQDSDTEQTQDASWRTPPQYHFDISATYTCQRCGAWVLNRIVHERFHAQYDPPPDGDTPAAFFSEKQVRAMVRDEVAAALDDFQVGMQDYLMARFGDLESVLRHAPRRNRGGR